MAWHIIRTLQGVGKVIGILRHQPAKKFLQIGSCRRIRVFEKDETCAGMFQQNGRSAGRDARVANDRPDSIGDLVSAYTTRRYRKSCAKSLHHTPTERAATT